MSRTEPARGAASRPARRTVLDFPAGAAGGRRWVWLASALAVLLLAVWVLLASPALAVHSVRITGDTDTVRGIAKTVSAPQRGRPLLRVDVAALEARIESDSRVADATVRRGFPRSLIIEVVARVPVLAVANSKGKVDVLDIDGTVVERGTTAPKGVPTVAGTSGQVTQAGVRAALEVLVSLPAGLRTKVTNLRIDETESVAFRIGSTTISWGGADRGELKARLVQILLTKKPKTIDVTAPDTPVTT